MNAPRKYTKKPVTIEAMQVKDDRQRISIRKWAQSYTPEGKSVPIFIPVERPGLEIYTLEGMMTADVGDYIIRGVNGEFYPCKPDIFNKTYSECPDSPDNNSKQL